MLTRIQSRRNFNLHLPLAEEFIREMIKSFCCLFAVWYLHLYFLPGCYIHIFTHPEYANLKYRVTTRRIYFKAPVDWNLCTCLRDRRLVRPWLTTCNIRNTSNAERFILVALAFVMQSLTRILKTASIHSSITLWTLVLACWVRIRRWLTR